MKKGLLIAVATASLLAAALRSAAEPQPPVQPGPLQRLQASIERITSSVNATWGIWVKSLETGEEIGRIAEQVGAYFAYRD